MRNESVAETYILALDQGTTSCRTIVFDQNGRIVNIAQQAFTQFFPQPGWVEHDAEQIWQVQLEVMKKAASKVDTSKIAAIGITNQRETTVIWDRHTGKPLCRAIVWQDRRTSSICEQMKADGWEKRIRSKTGLVIDPYFSGTKIKWLLDQHDPIRQKAYRGEVLVGTIDSWLIWNLTGGQVHVTDYSNASRTMLYNIHELDWDQEILDYFNIPSSILPEVKPSSHIYGYCSLIDGVQIPIAGAAGDQQAALFGQACHKPGMAKNTYGTGCFLLSHTGDKAVDSKNGLLTTIAWGMDGKVAYALEGSVFVAGAVVQWLRDELGIIESAAETEQLARSVTSTGGVYFVPAFTGLGTPYWNPHARGMISGLTRGTTRAHLVRAALEAIAFQNLEVLQLMEKESGIVIRELRVDGGATENLFLMQFQADLLGTKIVRAKVHESTAQGAAYLAGLATGVFQMEDMKHLWEKDRVFHPTMSAEEREKHIQGWKTAVGYQINKTQ